MKIINPFFDQNSLRYFFTNIGINKEIIIKIDPANSLRPNPRKISNRPKLESKEITKVDIVDSTAIALGVGIISFFLGFFIKTNSSHRP